MGELSVGLTVWPLYSTLHTRVCTLRRTSHIASTICNAHTLFSSILLSTFCLTRCLPPGHIHYLPLGAMHTHHKCKEYYLVLYHSAWAFERYPHSVQSPCTLRGVFEARVYQSSMATVVSFSKLWTHNWQLAVHCGTSQPEGIHKTALRVQITYSVHPRKSRYNYYLIFTTTFREERQHYN